MKIDRNIILSDGIGCLFIAIAISIILVTFKYVSCF